MIIHEMEQRSEEWYAIRKGKMTASEASTIAANGIGLKTYAYQIVVGEITEQEQSFKGNKHTERGNDLEPEGRIAYEIARDVTVKQVGFIEMDEYVGCSPDGLIGEDGGFEEKCPDDIKYFKLLIGEEKPDEAYIWQCHMSLLITGRKWWDLMFYNPNFEQSMIVIRIYPDLMRREKLIIGIEKGKTLIKELKRKYYDGSSKI